MAFMPRRDQLRYRGDRELAESLLRRPRIKGAVDEAHRTNATGNLRRELLGSALRLSRAIAPAVVDIVDHCRRTLEIATETEVYVYPSPVFNAGCTNTEGGRVFVLLSSSLVDAFTADELSFVVGHELGHHLFDHHALPAVQLAKHDPELALELYAWQRAGEVSADRAGLACTRGLHPAGAAMFKLTSGLVGERVAIHVDELIAQAEELSAADLPDEEALRRDWLTTHPFSPLRVRALQLAQASELFTPGGTPAQELDDAVRELLQVMEPGWAREQGEAAEAMRRLFFAAGILVATASEGFVPEELATLERWLGPGGVPGEPSAAAVREVLPDRLRRVQELVPSGRRVQLVRDLCVVALADGRIDPHERAVLDEIARGIAVDPIVVDTAIASAARPLD